MHARNRRSAPKDKNFDVQERQYTHLSPEWSWRPGKPEIRTSHAYQWPQRGERETHSAVEIVAGTLAVELARAEVDVRRAVAVLPALRLDAVGAGVASVEGNRLSTSKCQKTRSPRPPGTLHAPKIQEAQRYIPCAALLREKLQGAMREGRESGMHTLRRANMVSEEFTPKIPNFLVTKKFGELEPLFQENWSHCP